MCGRCAKSIYRDHATAAWYRVRPSSTFGNRSGMICSTNPEQMERAFNNDLTSGRRPTMKKMTGIGCVSKKSLLGAMLALSAMTLCVPTNASAEDIKLAASAIGRPPIFSNTFVDVGQEKGYWKKAGLDVSFRWFQRGTDTAKAVVTGDVQLGYTATPPAVNLIESGAPVVIIAGMPNQDWLVASDDPAVKGCKELKGQTIAADGINNARYLFIQSVLQSCSLQLTDVKLIDLANAVS